MKLIVKGSAERAPTANSDGEPRASRLSTTWRAVTTNGLFAYSTQIPEP